MDQESTRALIDSHKFRGRPYRRLVQRLPPGGYANPEKPYSGSSRECWHMYTLYRAALRRVLRRLCIMQLEMSGLASSPAQSKVKCVSVSLHLQVFYLAEYAPNRRYIPLGQSRMHFEPLQQISHSSTVAYSFLCSSRARIRYDSRIFIGFSCA